MAAVVADYCWLPHAEPTNQHLSGWPGGVLCGRVRYPTRPGTVIAHNLMRLAFAPRGQETARCGSRFFAK